MAGRTAGTSHHTLYRRAREHLADLEVQYTKLDRSRPRSSGKRGWRTRRLNKLARRVSVAHGQVTKARKAVTQAAGQRVAAKRAATHNRSEAAKRGWEKRRAGKRIVPSGDYWQHLMPDGTTITVVVDKTDSSLEG
ncbi:MAG: hypothetical protein ACYDEW_06360, partial [Vulcanimicrobiaceae bacterium]